MAATPVTQSIYRPVVKRAPRRLSRPVDREHPFGRAIFPFIDFTPPAAASS
jgi:hypothetical protein